VLLTNILGQLWSSRQARRRSYSLGAAVGAVNGAADVVAGSLPSAIRQAFWRQRYTSSTSRPPPVTCSPTPMIIWETSGFSGNGPLSERSRKNWALTTSKIGRFCAKKSSYSALNAGLGLADHVRYAVSSAAAMSPLTCADTPVTMLYTTASRSVAASPPVGPRKCFIHKELTAE